MNGNANNIAVTTIQGQLLRIDDHHEIAIHTRNGRAWVADFVNGHGELMDATTWFRSHCGVFAVSHAWRRIALQTATPLSEEVVARIEALHKREESARGHPIAPPAAGFSGSRVFRRVAILVAEIFGRRETGETVRLRDSAQT